MAGTKSRMLPPSLAASMALSLATIPPMPPAALTESYASTMTMPIFNTNWNRSVTSTPQRPDSVLMPAVRRMMQNTRPRAWSLSRAGKITIRILTMARLTQPRMMQLMGSPR